MGIDTKDTKMFSAIFSHCSRLPNIEPLFSHYLFIKLMLVKMEIKNILNSIRMKLTHKKLWDAMKALLYHKLVASNACIRGEKNLESVI